MASSDPFTQGLLAGQSFVQGIQNTRLNQIKLNEAQQQQPTVTMANQLKQRQIQLTLQNLGQAQKVLQAQQHAALAKAYDQEIQSRLDRGEPGQTVVNDFINRGALPRGTEAVKVPLDPTNPSSPKVWAVQNADIPGMRTPQIINPEAAKSRYEFSQKLDLLNKEFQHKKELQTQAQQNRLSIAELKAQGSQAQDWKKLDVLGRLDYVATHSKEFPDLAPSAARALAIEKGRISASERVHIPKVSMQDHFDAEQMLANLKTASGVPLSELGSKDFNKYATFLLSEASTQLAGKGGGKVSLMRQVIKENQKWGDKVLSPDSFYGYSFNPGAIADEAVNSKMDKVTSPGTQAKAQEFKDAPVVKDKAEYDKLPSGTVYIAPDGHLHTKK